MRSVDRGERPKDNDGVDVVFKEYAWARRYLIDRIGEYCSYCERKIQASLAVEHVQPKDLVPELVLAWDNFLLACTNCNSTKGDTAIMLSDYVWPDVDNTYACFDYPPDGLVSVSEQVEDEMLKARVEKTIQLFGLAKKPPNDGTQNWQKASDRRVEQRIKVLHYANQYSELYHKADDSTRRLIVKLLLPIALESGFWSIWAKAFEPFPEVFETLKAAFPGTRWPEK